MCSWNRTNETELLAINCIQQQQGSFFDACSNQCMSDVYFLYLRQDLGIEHFVYGHLFPVLVALVVLTNGLVVVIYSKKNMLSSTNIILKYMALADLCVGLVPLPWTTFYYSLRNYEHEGERVQKWWCYFYKQSMDAMPPIFHSIAVWLTVLLAVQRFISIEYPLRSREICSVKNVRIATAVITLVSVLCGLPKVVDFYYDVYDGWAYVEPGGWQHVQRCISGFTFIVSAVGSNTFFNVYFLTRVFGFIVIPSFLLTILNALLIRGIRKAQKRKELLLREKRAREAQRQIDSNSTSIMLVAVVSIFLLVNLPQAIFMGLLCISSTLGVQSEFFQSKLPATFMLISNMLATYPINFCLYCFCSSSFRDTFRSIFCRKNWRHRLASNGGSGSAAFSRLSVRRSDPSVSVQLSGRHSSEAVAENSTVAGQVTTVVRQENSELKQNKNDTVFL
ncbi:G-PROTEIN-RECEP-F1-2 domain-containing protein [Aphelenchoides besseyi]|nr:G-PROTEIN-RECEP-F1-2 domain-containing protein [Aphelenchoides besseyi]